ncbi:MAG: GTP-binding protein [Candidatus Methanomethylophilaceae archaeon]
MHLIIVSGMLGVGKTSVILKLAGPLAESGRKIVIIENDFGALGVDSEIVRRNGMEVRELKGGCICCTLKAGLIDDLRMLQVNFSPDIAIIEPTGIADPEFIINSVKDVSGLRIDSVKTLIVIDAERFLKMKKMFERPLKNQLKVADVVLLNKVDTVSVKDLKEIEQCIRAFSYEGRIKQIQADKGVGLENVEEVMR